MTEAAFENALRVLQAIGGSTNGVVHLTAIAGPARHRRSTWRPSTGMGAETPVLVDLKPAGQHYMEDLHKAGGLTTILREIRTRSISIALTVTGKTLGENIAGAEPSWPQDVVRPVSDPIHKGGGMRVLRGNLAPNGALIKQAAASAPLLTHEGRAVVFNSLRDLAERVDDPGLDVERRRRAGAAERRPEGRAGHAGGRLSPDPEEARWPRASRTWCASPTRA